MARRILVCGGREWTDRKAVESFLREAIERHGSVHVIEGEAPGADSLARDLALILGCGLSRYPAQWDPTPFTPRARIRRRGDGTLYDIAAGHIRNQEMIERGRPDEVVAFHADIRKSTGTADMVRRAERAGLPVTVLPADTRRPQEALF